MKGALKLSHQAWTLIAVPLVFELVFVSVLVGLLNQAEIEAAREARARAILAETTSLAQVFYEQGITAIALGMIKGSMIEDRFNKNMETISHEILLLKQLTADDPTASKAALKVERVSRELMEIFKDAKRDSGDALFLFRMKDYRQRIKLHASDLLVGVGEIAHEQEMLVAEPSKEAKIRKVIQGLLYGGVFANVLLAIFLAFYFNQSTGQRLKVLMENTRRLAKREPLSPPLTTGDELGSLDGVFRDMARALDDAARKERAVVEYASDVICSLTPDGKFLSVSPASLAVWGYVPADLIGRSVNSFVESAKGGSIDEELEKLKNGDQVSAVENRITTSDGQVVDMLWSITWSATENAFFCVAHDITERKEIERLKQEFVNIVSHDLRSPLTSIQAALQMLVAGVRGPLNPGALEDIENSEKNVERLIRLINDLLDIAKMESGKWDLNPRSSNLLEIVETSISNLSALIKAKDVHIQVAVPEWQIYADPDRISQVVMNLLSNAIKYSPKESLIKIQASNNDEFWQLNIIDQGAGIPADSVGSIFDRFQQVKGTKGGSGLGLAICKAIIDSHGGEIGVDSEISKGSTFWFRVPHQFSRDTTPQEQVLQVGAMES